MANNYAKLNVIKRLFVGKFYQNHFLECEKIDLSHTPTEIICRLYNESQVLHKIILDDIDEGYDVELDFPKEAEKRLLSFMNDCRLRLSSLPASVLPVPCFEPDSIDRNDNNFFGKPQRLDSYLRSLEFRINRGKPQVSSSAEKRLQELEPVFHRIIEFVRHLITGQVCETPTYICLLRDCLLIYLALRFLRQNGVPLDVKPILLNRSYLATFSRMEDPEHRNDHLPSQLERPIYEFLLKGSAEIQDFMSFYPARLDTLADDNLRAAMSVVSNVEHEVLASGPLRFIETGAQGTIPLFLLTMQWKSNNKDWKNSEFNMYTCLPWLLELYGERIFSHSYQNLRDMESLVCQDQLFFFHEIKDNSVFIKETESPEIISAAYAEIDRFMEIVANSLL